MDLFEGFDLSAWFAGLVADLVNFIIYYLFRFLA